MRKIILPAAIILILTSVFTASSFSGFATKSQRERDILLRQSGVFFNVLLLAKSDYVDEVSTKKMLEGAMNGMLRSLDPYSQFLTSDAYEDLKMDTQGEYAGVGIEISVKGGFLHIIAPLDDSPAAQAGIKAGDTIIKIDDSPARDLSLADAVKKMRGSLGAPIKLTILREGESKVIEFQIKRDKVKVKSIKEAKLLPEHVGYIRISSFQERSAEDVEEALKGLESQGMSGLILDIRNNAGGLLDSAVGVTEKFIAKGKLIVSTKGRNTAKNADFISKNDHPHLSAPLVVLVDKGSASGSEILAGAIQDYHLGTIVGVKTFGKGSVQSLIPIGDGSAIRMTTSKYFTPNGRLIHEIGVMPDVIVEAEGDRSVKDNQLERAQAIVNEQKTKSIAA